MDQSTDQGDDLEVPDFEALFRCCQCGTCRDCGRLLVTPRTAAALWWASLVAEESGWADVEEHGNDPVEEEGDWWLFRFYPRTTWAQRAAWRVRVLDAYADLRADLEKGLWPSPRTTSEEMALTVMIEGAHQLWKEVLTSDPRFASLPADPRDFAWDRLTEALSNDDDFELLFDPSLDGVDDPENAVATWHEHYLHPSLWLTHKRTDIPPRDA